MRPRIVAPLLGSFAVAWSVIAGLGPANSAAQNFQTWLAGVRAEAADKGISKRTLDAALTGIKPNPRVIELDRKQPEFTWTFRKYLRNVVTDRQVANGRYNFRKNRALLQRIGAKYGVAPEIIVALWGVETRYGNNTGGFDVIRSLATLSFDGRRPQRFRPELFAALKIIDDGHISAAGMRGSWAGAMGQNQFMPSSFVAYAVDHNGDGRRDIWRTEADVLASAANYLSQEGWVRGERWGRPVTVPKTLNPKLVGREVTKRISEWRALGVRPKSRTSGDDLMASVIMPDGPKGPAYFAYENFTVIRRWNPSDYFALAVGTLADRISAAR